MRGWILLITSIILLLASSANALVFTVTEGELVKIKLKATDPDGNPLTYNFSWPLNEKGEWQTKTGDAGQYNVVVTVSDGTKISEEGFTLIVKEKEEIVEEVEEPAEEKEIPPATPSSPPVEEEETPITQPPPLPTEEEKEEIEKKEPEELEEVKEEIKENHPPKLEKISNVEVIEGDLVKISTVAYDEDDDELNYGFAYPLNEKGEWQTQIGDSGEYIVTVTAADSQSIDSRTFKVIVKKKKMEINFEKINDVALNENDEINIELKASVEEGNIEYSAENLPEGATLSGNTFHFKPAQNYVGRNIFVNILNKVYTYVPKKSAEVTFIAKSNDEEKKQDVKITVKDVNREPKLDLNDIAVNEGEKIEFNPIISDEDGDWLKVSYSGDIKNNYLTNFDDSGDYKVKAAVSDSYSEISKEFNAAVKNSNREPVMEEVPLSKVNENEELKIKLNGFDPDGDKLGYSLVDELAGAEIEDNVFSWKPGFDFVKKNNKQDLISKIKYFNKKIKQNNKEIEIRIGVSDGNITKETTFKVVVYDINRKPEIIKLEPEDAITAAKGARIIFSVDVNDPDEDELIYKWNFGFMNDLEAGNKVARTFTIKGKKEIKVTISDGVDEIEKKWRVKVI